MHRRSYAGLVVAVALFGVFGGVPDDRGPAPLAMLDDACGVLEALRDDGACRPVGLPAPGDRYVAPTQREREAWRLLAARMLDGTCAGPLPVVLEGDVALFEDGACVLADVRDDDGDGRSDLGWGRFVVASGGSWHMQAPHPLDEPGTAEVGEALLGAGQAASLAVAGARRAAVDAAHEPGTMFQASQEALLARGPTTVVQLHGMADQSCPGVAVYVTEGLHRRPEPDAPAARLVDALRAARPTWNATTYGDEPPCGLDGTNNLQGPDVRGAGGAFVHVEAGPGHRDPAAWVEAFARL